MTTLTIDKDKVRRQSPELTLEGTGVGMWAYNLADKHTTCDLEWFRQRGMQPTTHLQVDNTAWRLSIHPADRARINSSLEELHSGRVAHWNELYRIQHADGHWLWLTSRGSVRQRTATGKPTHFSGVDIAMLGGNDDDQSVTNNIPVDQDSTPAKALHAQEEFDILSVSLENSSQGVWHVDYENNTNSSTDTWRTMRGYPADSNYGYDRSEWMHDIHPQDQDIVNNHNGILGTISHDNFQFTYRQRHADTSWRWIWVRGKIIERNLDGSVRRMAGLDTDITSIKDAELKAERLSNTLDLALQAGDMGVWEWHLNANGSYCDATTCRIFGINGEGRFVPGKIFINRVHPDDLARIQPELERITNACEPIVMNFRILHDSLGERHIKVRAKCHSLPDEPTRYVGIVWDVTDTYQKEIELAEANHLLDDVIEHMDQGLVLFKGPEIASSQLVLANDRLLSILELPVSLKAQNTDFQGYVSHLITNHYLASNGNVTSEQFMQQFRDNKISACILTTPSGKTIRATAQRMDASALIITFSDITDLVRAEQERAELTNKLNHSDKLRSIGELTGGIAHDFNNLLAIIAGNAELLGMSTNENNRHLHAISEASHKGAELTQSLLAFSRKQALRPSSFSMQPLVAKVCSMLDRTLGDGITLSAVVPDGLWVCEADAGQLENALINLALNARDAMPHGGSLTIDVSNTTLDDEFAARNSEVAAGQYLQITVSDTGTGMRDAIADRAIEPFFTTKHTGKGAGLGLSMVFGFIKQSQGHLDIYSKPGTGTRVCLYLPRSHAMVGNEQSTAIAPRDCPRGQGQCILLVEDNSKVQQMIESSLDILGYNVLSVQTAQQALESIDVKAHSIDLVISDIMLPEGINGFELGRSIQASHPTLPIIYMSGFAQNASNRPDEFDDSVDLLRKPFRLDELADKITLGLVKQ